MRYFLLLYIMTSCCLGLAQGIGVNQTTSAKIQGFTITAENLSRDLENDTVTLEGHVKIIYQNQFIEADEVELNLKKKQGIFKGNVLVQTTTYQIGGQRVDLDYESNQGIIYIGYVQSNNVRFQGDVIEKLNEKEFFVTNSEYTTCSNCPSTWSFTGNQIRAELGGYAFIKNSILRVANFPVFWLPYLIVPLKSERQTGLLPPEIGYADRRNLVFSEDFFWAISRSQDMTITFKNYEIGGFKPIVEYRYVLTDNSRGSLYVSHIKDRLFSNETRFQSYASESQKHGTFNRWAVRSQNHYALTDLDSLRLQVALVSDLQYPKDFYDEFRNFADPSLENRLTYSHFFEHSTFSIDSSYYKNLLQANPLADNSASVHRLPELRFDSTYQKFFDTPLFYKFESSWTNFYREKTYDDISVFTDGQHYVSNNKNAPDCEKNAIVDCQITSDGVYNQDTDILRKGERLNFKGTLSTETFQVTDYLKLTALASYNESEYLFRELTENQNTSRRYLQFDINTRTKFYRIYEQDNSDYKYKNEIIPELQYSVVPWINESSHPFFGNINGQEAPFTSRSIVSNSDVKRLGGVLFDYDDRVYDRNIISFSLLDQLIRKRQIDSTYKTLMTFRLTQSYDLYQAQYGINKNQPLSDLSGTLVVDLNQIQSYTQANYFPYLSATDTFTSLTYLNEKQQYIKLGWSSKRTAQPKQDDVSIAIGFVTNYINLLTGVVYDASENRDSKSRLKKISLITQLKPPGECWAVNFYRDQKVGSGASWHVRFDFSFDGKPTKVIPPAELNIN